jgi:hypothetical protein
MHMALTALHEYVHGTATPLNSSEVVVLAFLLIQVITRFMLKHSIPIGETGSDPSSSSSSTLITMVTRMNSGASPNRYVSGELVRLFVSSTSLNEIRPPIVPSTSILMHAGQIYFHADYD